MRKPLFANVGGGQSTGRECGGKGRVERIGKGGERGMVEVSMESLSSSDEVLMSRGGGGGYRETHRTLQA